MDARSWIAVMVLSGLVGCGGGGSSDGGQSSGSGSGSGGSSGPGVVATQTVDVTQGGSIIVQAPGNPLNGTTVQIPAGALGASGTDTITIGYSDSLPGPLDPNAVAAGAQVVSKAIEINHTSTAELVDSLTVTVPYDTQTVGPDDVPVMLYWNPNLGKYEALKVISFDRGAGTITYRTHHFSTSLTVFMKGLNAALSGLKPLPANLAKGVHTDFLPNPNGFAVMNFSTVYGPTVNGACYGLVAFAKWNFDNKKPPLFTNYFGSDNPRIKNPLEQDAERELIYSTHVTTNAQNKRIIEDVASIKTLDSDVDRITDLALISMMFIDRAPQMLDLFTKRNYANPGDAHTVLVYGWSPGKAKDDTAQGFMIYDPNKYENTELSLPIPEMIYFHFPKFNQYYQYTLFITDSRSSWYSDNDLNHLYETAPSGSQGKFKAISLTEESSAALPFGTIAIDPNGGTTVHGNIDPHVVARSKGLYAYFYINDKLVTPPEIVNADGGFAKVISDLPPDDATPELLIIVAGKIDPNVDDASPTNQTGISNQYVGSARATLVSGKGIAKITDSSCVAFGDTGGQNISLTIGVSMFGSVGSRLGISNDFINGTKFCSAWTLNSAGQCQRMPGQPNSNRFYENSTFRVDFFTAPPYYIPSSIGAALYDNTGKLLTSVTSPVTTSCPAPHPCDPNRMSCK